MDLRKNWIIVFGGGFLVLAFALAIFVGVKSLFDGDQEQSHTQAVAAPEPIADPAADLNYGQKLALLNLNEVLSPDDERVQGVNIALLAVCSQYNLTPDEVIDHVWFITKRLREEGIETDAFHVLGVAIDGFVPKAMGGDDLPTLLAMYAGMRERGKSHDDAHAIIRVATKLYKNQ